MAAERVGKTDEMKLGIDVSQHQLEWPRPGGDRTVDEPVDLRAVGPDQVRRQGEDLRKAGFDHLIASWPEAGRARVEAFVEVLMPELVAD